jgi:hypothetical protein
MDINWYICDYHGTKTFGNKPVNLVLVETFDRDIPKSIRFIFPNNPPVIWEFSDNITRDLEYEKILRMLKKTPIFPIEQ